MKKGKEKNLKLVATCLRRDSHERGTAAVKSNPRPSMDADKA